MKFDFVAIALGTITDLTLSALAGPLELHLLGINESSPYLLQVSLCLGLVATAIGGYVTARQSKSSKLWNAAIFSLIQLVIAIAAAMFVSVPLWFEVASIVLIIPSALVGAYAALHL